MTEKYLPPRPIGYARVSTYGQTLDAQLEQLKAAGCVHVFREKVTGARADRKELLKMLRQLVTGDVVTVTRIDRLARSTFDLFAIVKQIADAGARFRSLAEPWADTGTSTGRLMLAVLDGLADVERDLIRTRTAEGRSRAMACGQHMGRPPSLTPQQQADARQRRAEGATLKELAQLRCQPGDDFQDRPMSWGSIVSLLAKLQDIPSYVIAPLFAFLGVITTLFWRPRIEWNIKKSRNHGSTRENSLPNGAPSLPM